jgi:hypothetical protein
VDGGQVVDGRAGDLAHHSGRQVERGWRLPAQDDAAPPLHHIEGRADHRLIVAVEQRARGLGVDWMQGAQHAVFAPHVVRRFDGGAEGRPAQHQFLIAQAQQVGEIGEAAGELRHHERAGGVRQIRQEIVLQCGAIQCFAPTNRRRLIDDLHTQCP